MRPQFRMRPCLDNYTLAAAEKERHFWNDLTVSAFDCDAANVFQMIQPRILGIFCFFFF